MVLFTILNELGSLLDDGDHAAAKFQKHLLLLGSQDVMLYALAMTGNGADGNTLAQMEDVLGMDCESLNSFMLAYMDQLSAAKDYKMSLANSIWFKDDPNFTVEQSFLQTNADYYGAGIYKSAFDEGTCREINDWVKDYTGGMIPEIVDEIPADAVMYLVNALAFDAQWAEIYRESQVWERWFTTEDGRRQRVDLMLAEEHAYLADAQATGFIKYYKDRKYAFVALLPNEGTSVTEYVDSLSGEHLRQLLAEPQRVNVSTAIPKFESECNLELGDMLKVMGMTDAFDYSAADFTQLGTYHREGMNIGISRVLHRTYISVGEQGTNTGAATAVEMNPGSAAPEMEIKEVILDRPFVYMLIDCESNLPFFMGAMMDMEAN